MPCHSSHNRTRCCSGSARACHKMCPDRSRHIQSGTQCVGSDGNTGTWRLLDLLWINNWINPTLSTLTQIAMIVGLFLVTDFVSPFMGTNLCWPQSAKAITAWRYHTPHRQPARNRDRRRDSSLWTPLSGECRWVAQSQWAADLPRISPRSWWVLRRCWDICRSSSSPPRDCRRWRSCKCHCHRFQWSHLCLGHLVNCEEWRSEEVEWIIMDIYFLMTDNNTDNNSDNNMDNNNNNGPWRII